MGAPAPDLDAAAVGDSALVRAGEWAWAAAAARGLDQGEMESTKPATIQGPIVGETVVDSGAPFRGGVH
jgi:hypothetical protein